MQSHCCWLQYIFPLSSSTLQSILGSLQECCLYTLLYTSLCVPCCQSGFISWISYFWNRKVSQMWDLVILLWTFLHGPLDKTAKLVCFLPKRLEMEYPWEPIYLFAEKKKSILFDEQVVGEHSLPLYTKSSRNMHVLVVGYWPVTSTSPTFGHRVTSNPVCMQLLISLSN